MEERKDVMTLLNDEGKEVVVKILFSFVVEGTNKAYIVYTFDSRSEKEVVDVLISEVDMETRQIKEIPEAEIATVKEYYEKVKNGLINKEIK